MHRLFVDVGYELSEHQLRQHFTKYGPVSDVYLPKHSMGRNKGYAFVTFSSEQALSKALLDPQPVVQGVKLKVKRATPRPPGKNEPALSKATSAGKQSPPTARVLIEGLDARLSEAQVQQHFSKWGAVSDVSLLPTQPTQTCIVTFVSHIDAKRACDQSERSLAGLAVKSIKLMTQSEMEQHGSMSYSGESPHGASDISTMGQATYAGLSDTAAAGPFSDASKPATISDFAQRAALLRAANPSAYATWLQLEQMQQRLLADNVQADSAPLFHDSFPQFCDPQNVNGSLVNAKQVPQQTFIPGGPSASPYSVPYLPDGLSAVNRDNSQQNLHRMLSQLYSQEDQPSAAGLYSAYSQSSSPTVAMPNPYLQPGHSPYMQPRQLPGFENTLADPYLQGLQGTGFPSLPAMSGPLSAGPQKGSNENVNHLRNFTDQGMASAGAVGQTGYPRDGKHAEAKQPEVHMQDQVQSNYSQPSWSLF